MPPPHRFTPAPPMLPFSTAATPVPRRRFSRRATLLLLKSVRRDEVAAPLVQGRNGGATRSSRRGRTEAATGGECSGRRAGMEEVLRGRGGSLGWATASREAASGGGRACEAGWRGSKALPQRSQPARRCESESESNRTKTPAPIGTRATEKSIRTPAQIGKKSMVSST